VSRALRAAPVALGALLCLGLLAFALAGAGSSAGGAPATGRLPLLLLGIVALAWFGQPRPRIPIAAIIPVGPILDVFFLTPGRGIYATEVVLLAAAAWWLARRALTPRPWPRPAPALLLWFAFAAVGLIALAVGPGGGMATAAGMRGARLLVLAGFVPLLLIDDGSDGGRRPRLLAWWTAATLGAVILLAAGGVAEFLLTIAGKSDEEPGSFYRGSVGLAVHLAFFAPLGLALWLGDSGRRWRLAGAGAWLAAAACLPLTASRGAMGSVAATAALLVAGTALAGDRRRLRAPLIALGVIAAAAVVLVLRPELAGESFAYKLRASLAGDFFSTRVPAWREASGAIAAHPLVGEGPEAYAPSIPLELARRLGLPAALLAIAAIVAGLVAATRACHRRPDGTSTDTTGLSPSSVALGVAAGLIGLLLVGLAETGLGNRTTPLLSATLAIASLLSTAVRTREP
jgi:hypothetical protein